MRIGPEDAYGCGSENIPGLLLEGFRSCWGPNEPGAFVGVETDEDWSVVELARVEELIRITRQEVAIGHRTELTEAEANDGILDFFGAQGASRLEIRRSQFVEEFLARKLRGRQVF